MRFRLLAIAIIATLLGAMIGPLYGAAAAAPTGGLARATAGGTSLQAQANPFANIAVHSRATTTTAANAFTGQVRIHDFGVQNGHLVAHIAVSGVVNDASGAHTVSQVVATVPATVTGTCQVLTLTLGPLHLNLLGLLVDLVGPNNGPITLTITAQQGSGLLLGNLVCAIANLLNQGGPPGTIATLLNKLLALLQKVLTGLTSTFVAGPANTLVQDVAISGTNVATTTATITAAAPTTGTCPVLQLNLGPLHLNLLGLVIDLSQVNLSITAQSAPGSLLGNLVCDIANLLNGGAPMSTIAPLLNKLLAVLPIKLVPIPLLML